MASHSKKTKAPTPRYDPVSTRHMNAIRSGEIRPIGGFVTSEDHGFVRTANGQAWLYMTAPSSVNVLDTDDGTLLDNAARPWMQAFGGLADMASTFGGGYRQVAKSTYREVHVLSVSTPVKWEPSRLLPEELQRQYATDFPNEYTFDRVTLLGVRLLSDFSSGHSNPLLGAVETVLFQTANNYEPDESFRRDRDRVRALLEGCGFAEPTPHEMARARCWWQPAPNPSGTPMMLEPGHLHVFGNWRQAKAAKIRWKAEPSCGGWPTERNCFPMTLVDLGPTDFKGTDTHDEAAKWCSRLLAHHNVGGAEALAVSLRALVEPAKVTAKQFRRDERTMLDNVEKQASRGELGRRDKDQMVQTLDGIASVYEQSQGAPPTLVDTAASVALPGIWDEDQNPPYPGVVVRSPMRQEAIMQAMQLGSHIRWRPYPLFWPTPIPSYAGLSGVTAAGDIVGNAGDTAGALLGWSESDRQPVYISPRAVQDNSQPPYLLVVGATGSGKSMCLLELVRGFARTKSAVTNDYTQVLLYDPKQDSDFTDFVRNSGGRVLSIDDLKQSDGVMDPIRNIPNIEEAKRTAILVITDITDSSHTDPNREASVTIALSYGLQHGADCTGEAISIALRDYQNGTAKDQLPDSIVEIASQLNQLAKANGLMRVIYGTTHGGPKLGSYPGLTLIKAGSENLMPAPGGGSSITARVQKWVIRLMVLCGMASLRGKDSVLVLDEAHVALGDGSGEVFQQIGRLARQWRCLPILASQRSAEFVKAELQGFISRAIVLAMSDKGANIPGTLSEAQAVLRLVDQPEGGSFHKRMGQPAVLDAKTNAPNYDSLYALRDPKTGKVIRGSVAFFVDTIKNNVTPVEIKLPPALFELMTNRASDVDRKRWEAARQGKAQG